MTVDTASPFLEGVPVMVLLHPDFVPGPVTHWRDTSSAAPHRINPVAKKICLKQR